ncbi:MAG: tetratricopeptide repeat protein [Candidatus Zixiibacteriota bacterium]|nr:MAG: tetratricopeptide repeat protein [candidate division Zixibacteria bacterium]
MTVKKLFVTSLMVLLALPPGAIAKIADEFRMANEFYEEKDYESAIRLYESILSQGRESAAIYFNLGNAYFKTGDLGHAVLYYSKAKRLKPDDEDIRHNLSFAGQFSLVQMEGVELNPVHTFFTSLVDRYRLSYLAWLSSAIFLILMTLFILRFGFGIANPVMKGAIIASLLLLLVSAGLTSFKYRIDYLTRRAVIVAGDSPVLTGPSDQSDVELEGAPGLIVEILDETSDYYSVLFENKRRGWIKKDLVAEI